MLMKVMCLIAYGSLFLMLLVVLYTVVNMSRELHDLLDIDDLDYLVWEAYRERIERDAEIFREVLENE